ncbi:DUF5994 family protein [Mycolicibacterium sp. XJ2546]
MTAQVGYAVSSTRTTGPQNTPRLRLKPKAPATGYVDGAWWPHSDDLARELPDLLVALSVRLGPISRVIYNLDDWLDVPARMRLADRQVRLDGYRLQPNHTIEVLGLTGDRIALLVVPPLFDPDQAHETLMTAAAPDDTSSTDALLEISEQDREIRDQTAVNERRWLSGAGAK